MLNLSEAIEHALQHNKSLQGARMEFDKSDKAVWESIAQGLPQVDGTVDYMTYFNYEMSFSFDMGGSGNFTPAQMQEALEKTLAAFPGVTTEDLFAYRAGTYFEGILADMMPPSTILMRDQSSAKVRVSQLIFSGQYIIGIQTAKLARRIGEQNLKNSELDIKESVITSYYLVLITEESLRILEMNKANLEETLDQTRTMFETGMAEQIDVDQLSITVNQLENSRKSLERNLELNYNLLRFQLGLEPDVELSLSEGLEALFKSARPESALLASTSFEQNPTYQMLKTQEEISKKMLAMQKWNYAPTLAGFYNYNAKIKTTNFDMNPNHLAGLTLSVPIFSSGMRKSRVDQAKIDHQMARLNVEILEDQLSMQEKQIRYNLQSALENYQTQWENVDVARRVYTNYERKYEQGMASSLDLTQANGNYLDAQSNYLQAILEVMNAKLALDKLSNQL